MNQFPSAAVWRAACANDPVLDVWAGAWSICFAIESEDFAMSFDFVDGHVQLGDGTKLFALAAPAEVWAKFLRPVPPRHHHGIFAMMYRMPEFAINGDMVAFMQHAHLVRRVLDIGKWLAMGKTGPAPAHLAPRGGKRAVPSVTGGYVPVTAGGTTYQIYYETAGTGQRRAVHAHRRCGRAAVPRADGRSPHHAGSPAGRVRPALARQVAATGRRHSRIVAIEHRSLCRPYHGFHRGGGVG
jgi:hypothetical protein